MKEQYKITFNCFIQPQLAYFSELPSLEEDYKRTQIIRKTRFLSANNATEAVKHLKNQWNNPIQILNIEKQKEMIR